MLQKIENYHHALAQLAEAVQIYTADPGDALYRDGLIQRFEFTVELAWKSLKEYLEDQGAVLGIASPRGVLQRGLRRRGHHRRRNLEPHHRGPQHHQPRL